MWGRRLGLVLTKLCFCRVTRDPSPQPSSGQDLPITATISGNPSGVNLIYRINYGPEKSIPMDSGDSSELCVRHTCIKLQIAVVSTSASFKFMKQLQTLLTTHLAKLWARWVCKLPVYVHGAHNEELNWIPARHGQYTLLPSLKHVPADLISASDVQVTHHTESIARLSLSHLVYWSLRLDNGATSTECARAALGR